MAKQTRQAIAEADVVVFLVDARQGLTDAGQEHRRSAAPLGPARRARRQQGGGARCPSAPPASSTSSAWASRTRSRPRTATTWPTLAELRAVARARRGIGRVARHACRGRRRRRQGRDRRAPERRQVDARQHAARRGARDRVRPAGHDARLDLSRLRAQRPPVHADRHRGRAPPRQGAGGDREVLGDQDAAGDRGRQRRRAAVRRASRASPSRTRTSPATSSRPAARSSSPSTSGTPCRADRRDDVKRDLDRKAAFLAFARHHYISAREGRGRAEPAALGRRRLRRGDGQAARRRSSRGRSRRPSCASSRRAPGMGRPKLRYAHQGGQNPPLIVIHGSALEPHPGDLPPLPGTFLQRGVPTARDPP